MAMEKGTKSSGRISIGHSGKRGNQMVKYHSKNKMCECTVCGEKWYEPANGNNHERQCPRGCKEEDLHTKVFGSEDFRQEILHSLVPEGPRLRSMCWGGLNLAMEDLAWKFEIKRK
jgi:hypothetical protein